MRIVLVRLAAPTVLFMLSACGGSDGGTGPAPTPIIVNVTPARDTLTVGTAITFHAAVTGTQNSAVTWSLPDGASSGAITSGGAYTAGSSPGTYRIVATSTQNGTSTDTSRAQVVAAPSALVTAPDSAYAGVGTIVASVPSQAGMSYSWTVTGGVITTGQTSASVSLTSANPATVVVHCTVTNLADSAVTGSDSILVRPAPPPPSITSWTATPAAVTEGQGASLTAVFSDGTGVVDQGIGAVASGVPIATGVLPFTTTFQLTVTGFAGQTAVAQLAVELFKPPQIYYFDPKSRVAPIGGSGFLSLLYEHWPDAVATIDHGIGDVSHDFVSTTPLSGTTLFTLTVKNGADSVVTDTATIVAVTPAPGAFSLAASLVRPRTAHAAITLNDGRVLVVGGFDSMSQFVSTAELYDPGSGTFSATGTAPWSPAPSSVLAMADGTVLMVGGPTGTSTQSYDPATGAFSARADMPAGRFAPPAAALLQDGRVLVATNGNFLYNPVADTWSATGGLTTGMEVTWLITLLDGRVLALGNGDVRAEIYDPTTGVFASTGSMSNLHSGGTFTRLSDGRVLVAGGQLAASGGPAPINPTVEVFDPSTGTFGAVGDMALARYGHSASLRTDGTVVILGGFAVGGPWSYPLPYGEIYDPSSGQFTPLLANFATPRMNGVSSVLQDGRILVTGGSVPPFTLTTPHPLPPQAELLQ